MRLRESSTRIIRAVKAESARYGYSGKDLAKVLKKDPKYIYERFRFHQPFSVEDVNSIAEWLGMTIEDIVKSAELDETVQRKKFSFAEVQHG